MRRLLLFLFLLIVTSAILLMCIPNVFSWRLGFRIRNRTGEEIVVNKIRIPSKKAAFVPHDHGDLVVKRSSGKVWRYRDLSPLDLEGTPYKVVTRYYVVPFGGGSTSVNLVVNEDGRMYAVLPDAKDVDVEKMRQPKGFPVTPDDGGKSSGHSPVSK